MNTVDVASSGRGARYEMGRSLKFITYLTLLSNFPFVLLLESRSRICVSNFLLIEVYLPFITGPTVAGPRSRIGRIVECFAANPTSQLNFEVANIFKKHTVALLTYESLFRSGPTKN